MTCTCTHAREGKLLCREDARRPPNDPHNMKEAHPASPHTPVCSLVSPHGGELSGNAVDIVVLEAPDD
jgi:hypothetical protein